MGLTDRVTLITALGGLVLGVLNTYWQIRGGKPKYGIRLEHLELDRYRLINSGRAAITVTVMMAEPGGFVEDVPEMFKLWPELHQDFTVSAGFGGRYPAMIRVFFAEGSGRRFHRDTTLLAALPYVPKADSGPAR